MAKLRALFVVGTRPDAIKTAPVVLEFQKFPDQVETILVSTGQHREMLDQALAAFGLEARSDLAVMQHGQTLSGVTSRILTGLDGVVTDIQPDIVFAQGDTTTTFVAGLTAFYHQVSFGHIEAGLRTPTVHDPFPEEFNRRAVGLVSTLDFPPTRFAADNLFREGHPADQVFITGNTGIDAVMQIAEQGGQTWFAEHDGRVVLLTTHRRENWGEPQQRIARAARRIVDDFDDVLLVVPMHKNPSVRETLKSILDGHSRIRLIEPPDYADFVHLMRRCDLALTDSGGVQEEAPTFGIPVLVLRETTERPEGVDAGTAKLIGTDLDTIVEETRRLLSSTTSYESMARAISPYGDGKASARIRYATLRHFGIESPVEKMWG